MSQQPSILDERGEFATVDYGCGCFSRYRTPRAAGFIYERGEFTTLDYPAATDTLLTAINDAGVIVGSYDFSGGLKAVPRR